MSQEPAVVRSLASLFTYILLRISVAIVLFCHYDAPDAVFSYLGHSKVSDSQTCLRLMINTLTAHSLLGLFGCALKKFTWIQWYAFFAWITLLVPMIINLNTSHSRFSLLNIMYLLDFIINFGLCRDLIIQLRQHPENISPDRSIVLAPKYDPPPKYEDVTRSEPTSSTTQEVVWLSFHFIIHSVCVSVSTCKWTTEPTLVSALIISIEPLLLIEMH